MNFDWKRTLTITATVVALIYALEYGVSLLRGQPFKRPATTSLIAALVAANLAGMRTKKKLD